MAYAFGVIVCLALTIASVEVFGVAGIAVAFLLSCALIALLRRLVRFVG